jgi:hypothetical protein
MTWNKRQRLCCPNHDQDGQMNQPHSIQTFGYGDMNTYSKCSGAERTKSCSVLLHAAL